MRKITDILRKVKNTPEMYVGGTSDNREEQLKNLQWFILGCQATNDEISSETKFMLEFGKFIRDKYGWSMSCGPIDAILKNCESPEKAWEFWWSEIESWKQEKEEAL